jgi:hypothetical protein
VDQGRGQGKGTRWIEEEGGWDGGDERYLGMGERRAGYPKWGWR